MLCHPQRSLAPSSRPVRLVLMLAVVAAGTGAACSDAQADVKVAVVLANKLTVHSNPSVYVHWQIDYKENGRWVNKGGRRGVSVDFNSSSVCTAKPFQTQIRVRAKLVKNGVVKQRKKYRFTPTTNTRIVITKPSRRLKISQQNL